MPVSFPTYLSPRGAALALAAALVLSVLPAAAQTPPPKKDEFQISAPYAILIDADSGTVLLAHSSKPELPATLTPNFEYR